MYEKHLATLISMYGLSPTRMLAPQKGYRNESYPMKLDDGTIKNLIIYKADHDILRRITDADKVSEYLSLEGFPVRRRVSGTSLVMLRSNRRKTYAGFYNYLPGRTIAWEAYTMEHLKLLGGMMSTMHSSLRKYPAGERLYDITHETTSLLKNMKVYFSDPFVIKAMEKKLSCTVDLDCIDMFSSVIQKINHIGNKQPLHMDFVRGNVLFDDKNGRVVISGIIDFEKTALGHPLFDIARTLAFLFVDCKYKSIRDIKKYFLYSGYVKRGTSPLHSITLKMNDTTYDMLTLLTHFFLLYDFYKFLKHNPYESLGKNEHFVRTRDALISSDYGILYLNKG